MISNEKVRVRVAPSPTGYAHVGTGYTMLFNYAFARKNKGTLILRLEDTDVKREVKGAEDAIYTGLAWLGFAWDEGPDIGGSVAPYRSSERLDLYKAKVQELLKKGLAYEDEGAIRFKNPGEDVSWNDLVRGEVTFSGDQITDFVILKSDGYPTYNFAVVVDDIDMSITHVIRGEEHISNTPRQLALYKAFAKIPPHFAHFSTLRNQEHKKLSKRRDPVDLRLYREQGYLPQALVNFLCLLGWSHPEGKEVFGMEEFIERFTLERVRKAGPIFDSKKLDWLNGMYLRQLSDEAFATLLNTHISSDRTPQSLEPLVPLIKERITKLSEAEALLLFFWEKPQVGKGLFPDEKSIEHVAAALYALRRVSEWSLVQVNEALSDIISNKGFKTGDFYMTMRLAIAGQKVTPPLNESMIILGKDEVMARLETAEKALIESEPSDNP